MPRLRIDDLLASPLPAAASHLDGERVKRYGGRLEAMPPVVVFETEDGLLLADGYHRVAAARRRGDETIEAELRRGTRHDALLHAAHVAAGERGISRDEALSFIRRRSRSRWKNDP